jgi:hypothetical protein
MNQAQQWFDEVAAFRSRDEKAVASLAQGKGTLYSGSADGGISAWDLSGAAGASAPSPRPTPRR